MPRDIARAINLVIPISGDDSKYLRDIFYYTYTFFIIKPERHLGSFGMLDKYELDNIIFL